MADYVNIGDQAFVDALARILSGPSWLSPWQTTRAQGRNGQWALLVTGAVPGRRRVTLCVEIKSSHFQPSQFASLAARSFPEGHLGVAIKVLAMPRVTARMAALCGQHGWSWYDLAGNCRLEIPGALLIEHSGRAPVERPPRGAANLGTREAGRVIRALLAPENAGRRWTQRALVAHFEEFTGIEPPSLALVNKVFQHLRDQAIVGELPNRGFRVRDHEGLLSAWSAAYRPSRHVRRPYFTLLRGQPLRDRIMTFSAMADIRMAYAAFSAAEIQAPAVRQPRTWLYLMPEFEQRFASILDAKEVDSGENIVVLLPDDGGVFYGVDRSSRGAPCTNPIQTYVDVRSMSGRGEEAAEAILTQRLRPAWSAASA